MSTAGMCQRVRESGTTQIIPAIFKSAPQKHHKDVEFGSYYLMCTSKGVPNENDNVVPRIVLYVPLSILPTKSGISLYSSNTP
jgi:hypothetical protein